MIGREIIKQITEIVGKENVVEDKESRICYAYDATNIHHLPDLVVFPGPPSTSPGSSNSPTSTVSRLSLGVPEPALPAEPSRWKAESSWS